MACRRAAILGRTSTLSRLSTAVSRADSTAASAMSMAVTKPHRVAKPSGQFADRASGLEHPPEATVRHEAEDRLVALLLILTRSERPRVLRRSRYMRSKNSRLVVLMMRQRAQRDSGSECVSMPRGRSQNHRAHDCACARWSRPATTWSVASDAPLPCWRSRWRDPRRRPFAHTIRRPPRTPRRTSQCWRRARGRDCRRRGGTWR